MIYCFWILTDGKIVLPDSYHIGAVVSAPELFGESRKSIKDSFHKYGQNPTSNVESQARQEVLLRVINRNNIRIRKNILKRQQNWSIQLYRLIDERKAAIATWAKYFVHDGDQYADVIVHQMFDDSKIETSLNLLVDESTAYDAPVILKQSEL